MIPTTVTSSPSTATASISTSSINNNNSSSSSSNNGSQQQNNSSSMMIGIASLILEGRAIAEDDFHLHAQIARIDIDNDAPLLSQQLFCSSTSGSRSVGYSVSGGVINDCGGKVGAGRQSPKPSTSRAAISGYAINITTNPHPSPHGCATTPLYIDPYNSSSSTSSSAESTHQRWTQKLCQLRQASPAASLSTAYEQKVAIDAPATASGEPEFVALAINESSNSERCDYEIVRRVMLNRANVAPSHHMGSASAASSPGSGSENFLHSLQSLATTCLRGGTPAVETGYCYATLSTSPLVSPSIAATGSKYSYRATPPRFQSSFQMEIQSGSGACSGGGGGGGNSSSTASITNWIPATPHGGNGGCATATTSNCSKKDIFWRPNTKNNNNNSITTSTTLSGRIPIPYTVTNSSNNPTSVTAAVAAASSSFFRHAKPTTATTTTKATVAAAVAAATTTATSTYPQQGPHCDQFLRKMGLAKGEAAEAEDHFCDMSYVNITCSRWRAYCIKMEAIIARGEPICIEVYLGPVGHKILLEQWIINQNEKVPPPTMTLPSLCGAIRSQLYFSQISAWCDLIKKSDQTIYDTGRIIFPTATGAAGDLATLGTTAAITTNLNAITPSTSPNNASGISTLLNSTIGASATTTAATPSPLNQLTNAMLNRRPRLNIFYRIKQYDSTACFNSKPNVHNFPHVNITENCSISVCLKSLPRINGGIPKIGLAMQPTALQNEGGAGTGAAGVGIVGDNIKNGRKSNSSNGGAVINERSAEMSTPITTTAAAAAVETSTSATKTSRSMAGASLKTICDNMKINVTAKSTSNTNSSSSNNSHSNNGFSYAHAPTATTIQQPIMLQQTKQKMSENGKSNCGANSDSKQQQEQKQPQKQQLQKQQQQQHKQHQKHVQQQHHQQHSHRCTFYIDEDELDDSIRNDEFYEHAKSDGADCCYETIQISHREKQLLKYRKRMQKRDKKQKKPFSCASDTSCESNGYQPMEQGDDELSLSSSTLRIQTASASPAQHIEMISTGTQTQMTCCQMCGNEKTLICLSCCSGINSISNYNDLLSEVDDMDSSSSSLSSSEMISSPRNQAELLLQAIQRTPKVAKKNKKQIFAAAVQDCSDFVNINTIAANDDINISLKSQNNNHLSVPAAVTGCQVCKRQKTQHNFRNDNTVTTDAAEKIVDDASVPVGTAAASAAAAGDAGDAENDDADDADGRVNDIICDTSDKNHCELSETMDEEIFISSTKLTPHIERCSLNQGDSVDNHQLMHVTRNLLRTCTPTTSTQSKIEFIDKSDLNSAQFRTPPQGQLCQKSQQQKIVEAYQHKSTPKPNLLQISCDNVSYQNDVGQQSLCKVNYENYGTPTAPYSSLLMRKAVPKVNLTSIFCNPESELIATSLSLSSSPIPISCSTSDGTNFSFEPAALNRTTNSSIIITIDNNVPVQKSFSAPTLPNSPSLSPRFAKQAAIYKRRSRHLSDRSDRSSLGSDEQYSDEDFETTGGVYSPATSPMKNRTRLGALFGRLPLLGNLEESLLQKRLMPKIEVMGFKVLLGASGGFCPTQLTIPASAYFYELNGTTLSTPYVCDIRLPRKGYSVPRAGTVQATLLNPMGTVVRMFVIPYDMRDMPPLHQTFIRQRVLAEASSNETLDFTKQQQQQPELQKQQYNSFNNNNNNNKHFNNNNNSNSNNNNNKNIGNGDAKQNGIDADNSMQACFAHANGDFDNGYGDNGQSVSNNNNTYHRSPSGGLYSESNMGHFISAENMKRLRYSIHLRFQTSRSGRLSLHTDIRLLISRRTDCDTAAAHAKGVLEAPNDLITDTVMPMNPKYSARQENSNKI